MADARPLSANEWMRRLRGLAQEWAARERRFPCAQTPAYIDLMFAFGLARLGDGTAARELLGCARDVLAGQDTPHRALYDAFEYRTLQALDGKPHNGLLPDSQLQRFEGMDQLLRYVVDRLRNHSRILEPDQRLNPYRHWGARISDFEKALAELTDLTDRNELASRVDRLLREVPEGADRRARVISAGLEAAPRVGEDFARKMLDQAVDVYEKLPEATEPCLLFGRVALIERALSVIRSFRLFENLPGWLDRSRAVLHAQSADVSSLPLLDFLIGACMDALLVAALPDDLDAFLYEMRRVMLQGREVSQLTASQKGDAARLRSQLLLTRGWFAAGSNGLALPVLDVAFAWLRGDSLPPREREWLACTTAAALGHAPPETAHRRLEALFSEVRGLQENYTTSSHYSVSQLGVVESVVLAATATCERTCPSPHRQLLSNS